MSRLPVVSTLVATAIATVTILAAISAPASGEDKDGPGRTTTTLGEPVTIPPAPGDGDGNKPSTKPRGPDRYCDELNATTPTATTERGEPGGSPAKYSPHRVALGLFRYSDGREDREYKVVQPVLNSPYIKYPVDKDAPVPPGSNAYLVTEIVSNGGAPTHERHRASCKNGQDERLVSEYWVMLPTSEAVAEIGGLFGKVIAQLSSPKINFVDRDREYGWLWVNVDHHINVPAPQPVYESLTLTNQLGQTASAEITATPIGISVAIEDYAGAEHLSECTMPKITSKKGCAIRFTHATSISDDGRFHGEVRVAWKVTSTSGKYDGLGPFYTVSKFSTRVGEAMAVSGNDNQ